MPTFSSLVTCQIHKNPALVLPSLAYQLAHYSEEFKCKLTDVLSHDSNVATRDFVTQFDQLIQLPWEHEPPQDTKSKTVLVVLDAIDECEDEVKGKRLLQTLLKTPMPRNVLVFLASRPEAYIRSRFL